MWKSLLAILVGILAGLWEVSAVPFFPNWISIYPVIALGVFIVLITQRQRWLLYALSAGFVIDLFSFSSGSLSFLRLVLIFYVVEQIANRWLTNRSLLAALALVISARLMDLVTIWLFSHVLAAVGAYPYANLWPSRWLGMLVWDVLQMSLWFGIGLVFTRRFLVSAGSQQTMEPPYGPAIF